MKQSKSIILLGLAMFTVVQIFSQYGTGYVLNPKSKSSFQKNASSMGFSSEVPKSYSLKMYAPYVKNQGIYGSCGGWAVSYEALSIQYAIANGITNRNHITSKAFDPYYSYNKIHTDNPTCDQGSNFGPMLLTLYDEGGKKFYLPLLGCGVSVTDEFSYATKNYKIKDAYLVEDAFAKISWNENDEKASWKHFFDTVHSMDINSFKKNISNKYPIVFSVALPSSFYTAGELWEPTPEEKADPATAISDNTGGHRIHAMTIVGYDDKKYGGAFEIMNSWSEGWGNKGFVWIKYEDLKMYLLEAYVMELFPQDESMATKTGVIWGDCEDGYGFYRFASGQAYEGQFKNAMRNGYGIFTWPNGMAYAGQWKDDKFDGEATFYYVGGTFGQATYSDGKFVSGYDELTYTNGDTYKGYIKDGELNGYGEYKFANGDKYTGMFANGAVSGLSKFTGIDGSSFIGTFFNNKKNGEGLEVSSTGKVTAGAWLYGVPVINKSYGFASGNTAKSTVALTSEMYLSADCESGNCLTGEGKRVTNGCVYTGTFLDGLEDGQGKMVYTNATYEGLWKQGQRNGIGKLTFTSGATEIAEFVNGKEEGYVLSYDTDYNFAVFLVKNGVLVKQIQENSTASTSASVKIPTELKVVPIKVISSKK